jgi:hypothetical protein
VSSYAIAKRAHNCQSCNLFLVSIADCASCCTIGMTSATRTGMMTTLSGGMELAVPDNRNTDRGRRGDLQDSGKQ